MGARADVEMRESKCALCEGDSAPIECVYAAHPRCVRQWLVFVSRVHFSKTRRAVRALKLPAEARKCADRRVYSPPCPGSPFPRAGTGARVHVLTDSRCAVRWTGLACQFGCVGRGTSQVGALVPPSTHRDSIFRKALAAPSPSTGHQP